MNVFDLGRTSSGMFNFANEMIEFQDDQFGHQLEGLFTEIKNTYAKPGISMPAGLADKFSQRMSKLIFARFGLKCTVVYTEHMAAIMPLYANRHHIFMPDMWKGYEVEEQAKFLSKLNNKKGTVDLAKAKIGGIYSEYEHNLYINYDDFFSTGMLTPAQATGITLHELGHGFYSISHGDRWHSANQVLSDIAIKSLGKKQTDRTLLYKELEKYNENIKKEELDKMINGEPVVSGYLWFKYIAEGNFNAAGGGTEVKTYDKTSCEQMADNFAARFGYGREVVEGLEAIYKVYGSVNHSWLLSSVGLIFELLWTIGGLAYCILGIIGAVSTMNVFGLFQFVMLGIAVVTYIFSTGEATRNYTYDELKYRYKRLRDQMVTSLKDKSLPKNKVTDIVKNIEYTDEVMKKLYEDWSVYRVVLNRLIPAHWAAKNSIEDQQLLETLAANAMFMKAAQIRTAV